MLSRIKQLLAPPVFKDEEEKTRVASLLNTILIAIFVMLLFTEAVTVLVTILQKGPLNDISTFVIGIVLVAILLFLTRRGYIQAASIGISLMLLFLVTFFVLSTGGGVSNNGISGYVVAIVIAGLLLGGRAAIITGAASILLVTGIAYNDTGNWLDAATNVSVYVSVFLITAVLLRLAANSINEALERVHYSNEELRALSASLEERVIERTRDLALAVEVGRTVSQVQDLDRLLQQAVDLIRSRFGLYYTQIYLLDPSGFTLILRAGTGSVGQELIRQRHRLPIGHGSLNGRAASEKRAILVPDTEKDPTFLPNPLLPETRSEMSIPLLIGERVVGVLDLQSREAKALTEDNLPAFEALASQLAIAIENARLFVETSEAKAEIEAQAKRLVRSGWEDFLNAVDRNEYIGYLYTPEEVISLQTPLPSTTEENELITPISVTGESIGKILLEGNPERRWTDEENELVTAVARQVARQVENLRLLAQAEQYRTEAEEATRRLTYRVWKEYQEEQALATPGYVYQDHRIEPLEKNGASRNNDDYSKVNQPLTVRGEVIGELMVTQPQNINEEATEMVSAVASQLSNHLENLRLTAQTQRALALTESLYAASDRIIRATTLEGILESLVRSTSLRQLDGVSLLFYDKPVTDETALPDSITITASWERDETIQKIPPGTRLLTVDYPFAHFISKDEPTIIRDVDQDERVDELTRQHLVENLHTHSTFIFPLTAGNLWFGLLSGWSGTPLYLSEEQVRQISSLTDQAATVIQNQRLFEQTQEALAETRSLYGVSEALTETSDLDEALVRILETLNENGIALGAQNVTLTTVESDQAGQPEWITTIASWYNFEVDDSIRHARYPVKAFPFAEHLLEATTPIYIEDINTDERVDEATRAVYSQIKAASSVTMPLRSSGRWLGILSISFATPRTFPPLEQRIYNTLIDRFAIVLDTYQLNQRVQLLASIVENHPDFIGVGDLEGNALYVNPAGLEMLGLSPEHDVRTMDAGDFYREADAQLLVDEGIPAALETGSWTAEAELLRTDGTTLPIEETVGINYDENNNPASFSITMRDITERKEAAEALAKQAQELQTVAEVSTAVATTLDEKELLQNVANLTKTRFDLYHAHIYLLNESGDTLVLAAGAGEIGPQMVAEGHQIPLEQEQSLVARAARLRQGVIVNDVQADPNFLPNPLLPETRAEMAVPMLAGDQLVGVLDTQSEILGRFTSQDVSIKTTLAAQISVALQNARLFTQAQRRAERERLVNTITQRIQGTATMESALQTAIQELGQALQARYSQVELHVEHRDENETPATKGNGAAESD